MERKRVRVYKPGGSLTIFENGGIQGTDQGGNVEAILSAYVNMKSMTNEEGQRFYTEFQQLQPEEQQTVLLQIAQEIQGAQAPQAMSPEPTGMPQAKYGMDFKSIKKSLKKKIGGITADPNTTAKNIQEERVGQIMNAIGTNWMNNTADKAYSAAQSMQNQAGIAMSQMARGGTHGWGSYAPFYGGTQGEVDPRLQDSFLKQSALNKAGSAFLGATKDLLGSAEYKGIKVKAKGPMFEQGFTPQSKVDPTINPVKSYDDMSQDELYSQFGLKYGGNIPSYQNAGNVYLNSNQEQAFNDLNIKDEDYIAAKKAYDSGSYTSDQLDLINRIDNYASNVSGTSTQSNTNTNNKSGSDYYTGWQGGLYFKDGILQYGLPTNNQGNISSGAMSFAYPGMKSVQDFISGYGPQGIANAFKALTPEDVYLSNLKVTPRRLKAKWRYMPDGSVQQVDGVSENDFTGMGEDGPTPVKSNIINRAMSPFRSSNEDDGSPSAFSNLMGRAKDAFGQMQAKRWANKYGSESDSPYFEPASETPANSTGYNVPVSAPMGKTSGSGMESIYEAEPTTPNPVYAPVQPNPRQTMETLDENMFAQGGMAGKLVLKNQYDFNNQLGANALLTGADMLSAGLEYNQSQPNEGFTTAMNQVPTLREGMPMGRGAWGVGPGMTGQPIPWMQPGYGEAYRFPQPMDSNTGEYMNFYGQDGGTYQLGGPIYDTEDDYTYLTEEEINDIMRRGGKVKYL